MDWQTEVQLVSVPKTRAAKLAEKSGIGRSEDRASRDGR